MTVQPGEKIALVGPYHAAKSALLAIIAGELEADAGSCERGSTVSLSYFPKDSSAHFQSELTLLEVAQTVHQGHRRILRPRFSGPDARALGA